MPRPSLGEKTDRAALAARLASAGLRGDPFAGGPLAEVYLMLTMGCNLRCRACSLWGVGGACHDGGYLARTSRLAPLPRLLALVDAVARRGAGMLTLTGGEPLMSRRWRPLAERARARGLKTALTTNGTLLAGRAAEVAEGFDQVNVSVATPPELRDELRPGPAGHWERMLEGLRALAAARRRAGGRPRLRLLCEVFDSNAAALESVVASLEREGAEFDEIYIQHLIFNPPEALAAQEAVLRAEFGVEPGLWRGYGYAPRAMDFAAFDASLERVRRRWPRADFSVDLRGAEALRGYYAGDRAAMGQAWCDGPWRQVNVLPNGEVWACPDVVLGSVAERDFDDIWDGPAARALRRRVADRLLPACRGCFYFYGDGHFPRRRTDA